jgi:hypothetical protein
VAYKQVQQGYTARNEKNMGQRTEHVRAANNNLVRGVDPLLILFHGRHTDLWRPNSASSLKSTEYKLTLKNAQARIAQSDPLGGQGMVVAGNVFNVWGRRKDRARGK